MTDVTINKAMLIFTSGGYFERGQWITPHSLAAERAQNTSQPKFELITHEAIPVFRQGACTGYKDEKVSMGIFTQEEIKLILVDTSEMAELASRSELRQVS